MKMADQELQELLSLLFGGQPMKRPQVITLCGSTRFWTTFQEQSLRLTLEGKIVLSVGAATSSDDQHIAEGRFTEQQKKELDDLHLHKINMSDEIFVLNVDGYIGPSTAREMVYCLYFANKPVRVLHPEYKPCEACVLDVLLRGAGQTIYQPCSPADMLVHAGQVLRQYDHMEKDHDRDTCPLCSLGSFYEATR